MGKTEIRYFTPLIDSVVEEYGLVTAAVLGAALRFCQMEDEVCSAAQEKIAKRLHLSRATVNHHLGILVDEGFLEDLTPKVRNCPHTYTDTGKANFRVVVEAVVEERGVKEIDTSPKKKAGGVKEIDTRCQPDLHPGVKEIDKKKDSLRNSSRNEERDIPSTEPASPPATSPDPAAILASVKRQLSYEMDKRFYAQYIAPLRVIGFDGRVFRVQADNPGARDWVLSRAGRQITRYLIGATGDTVLLDVQAGTT